MSSNDVQGPLPKDYRTIILTNADTRVKVTVMCDNIDFFYWREESQCSFIFFSGQNGFTAQESPEQIQQLLATKGAKHE